MELHTDDGRGGSRRLPGLAVAGMASVGAGAVHAAAAGIHAEHPQLARLFVVMAAAQIGFGLWALLRPSRTSAWGVVLLNAVAVGAWAFARLRFARSGRLRTLRITGLPSGRAPPTLRIA